MIILREHKSVMFWLIFVSSWIIGLCPCCNEEDTFSKIEEQPHFNDVTRYLTKSLSSQKKWTFFKIAITPKDKNTNISLRTKDIVSEEYIRNKNKGNNNEDVNNIDTWQNNINENVILKKFNNHKLNAYIVGYSDVNFTAGNIINAEKNMNNNEEGDNNEEGTQKIYYYVLIKDITHKANVYKSLFSALEETAENKKFSYSIEIIAANTTEVTDMRNMFFECGKLTEIEGLEKLDTSKVEDMSCMFLGCYDLKSLPNISNWHTNKVTNMSHMFYGCNSLGSLHDISKWDTSNVTNMIDMFYKCTSLTSLPDISTWNTSKVTAMSGMFDGCSSLKSLPDISKWNISNVTNMNYMFYNCSSLNPSNEFRFKIPNICSTKEIHKGCNDNFKNKIEIHQK